MPKKHKLLTFIEYDFYKKAVNYSENFSSEYMLPESMEDFPKSFVDNNIVEPKYQNEFVSFINKLHDNNAPLSITVQTLSNKNKYVWVRINGISTNKQSDGYNNIFLLFDNIETEKALEHHFSDELKYLDSLVSEALLYLETNITNDLITDSNSQIKGLKNITNMQFSKAIKIFMKMIVPEYRNIFKKHFDINYISEIFSNNNFQCKETILIYQSYYKTCWCEAIWYYIIDEHTREVKCRLYLKDIDKIYRQELKLKEQTLKEPLTQLYNRIACEKLINQYISKNKNRAAFLMFDVDNFKTVNDQYGHLFGDQVLIDISKYISLLVPKDSIIGRLGGDEFGIFIPNVDNDTIARIATNLCSKISNISFGQNTQLISCSIGIDTTNNGNKTFEQLYKNADRAQYFAKKNGKNQWRFYDSTHESNNTFGVETTNKVRSFDNELNNYVIRTAYDDECDEEKIISLFEMIAKKNNIDYISFIDFRIRKQIINWPTSGTNLSDIEFDDNYDIEGLNSKFLDFVNAHYFESIESLNNEMRLFCNRNHISAGYSVPVYYNKQVEGMILFICQKNNHRWTESEKQQYNIVSKVLSVCLERMSLRATKSDFSHKLKQILPSVLFSISNETPNQMQSIIALYKKFKSDVFSFFLEPNLPFNFIDSEAYKIFKYQSQIEMLEALDNKYINLVHPEDHKKVVQMFFDIDNCVITPYRVVNAKNEISWIRVTVLDQIYVDERKAIIVSCFSVTKQINLENMLNDKLRLIDSQSSELKLYKKLSSGGIFRFSKDVETGEIEFLLANNQFFNILECDRNEYSSYVNSYSGEKFLGTDLFPKYKERFNQALENGTSTLYCEDGITTAKGNRKYISSTINLSYQDNKVIIEGFISVLSKEYVNNHQFLSNYNDIKLISSYIRNFTFEINLNNKTVTIFKNKYNEKDIVYDNVPESLIEAGVIHEESIDDYREMFTRVFNHEQQVNAIIKIINLSNQYQWYKHTIVVIDVGDEYRAVGICENISVQYDYSGLMEFYDTYKRGLANDFILYLKVNLDENSVEYYNCVENICAFERFDTLSQFVADSMKNIIDSAERKKYAKIFNHKMLIDDFKYVKNSFNYEFKYTDLRGKIIWVKANINLLLENDTHYGYIVWRDITEKKKVELSLDIISERDEVSQLYNRQTTIMMIDKVLEEIDNQSQQCAFIIIDIDDFTSIVNKTSDKNGDAIIFEVGRFLLTKFESNDIIGHMGKDVFVAFMRDVPSEHVVLNKVEDICNSIRGPFIFELSLGQLTASIGYTYGIIDGESFETLYKKALSALVSSKKSGKGIYSSYSDVVNQNIKASEEVIVNEERNEIDDMLYPFIIKLLTSVEYDDNINEILKYVCHHYGSESCLIIGKADGNKLYEYCNVGVESLESKIDFWYVVNNIWNTMNSGNRSVVIDDVSKIKNSNNENYASLCSNGIDGLILTQINTETDIYYIVIRNPIYFKTDSRLPERVSEVIKNILNEHNLIEKQDYLRYYDELTGLKNRNCYFKDVDKAKEATMSSLAVASIDINGLKDINQTQGYEYGDTVIKYVASTLVKYFGVESSYRFVGDEFMIFMQDIDYEAFVKKIEAAHSEMNDKYKAIVSIGYNWTDTDFEIDEMTKYADEKMIVSKQKYYQERNTISKHSNDSNRKILNLIKDGYFQVYMQPKVSLMTGELVGAEALIRYNDPELGIVAPSRFISKLENENLISYVDLFVFEKTCQFIANHLRFKKLNFKISLNFSRITLLSDNLVIQLKEILEKYNVDPKYIDLEITESLSVGGTVSLVTICNQLKKIGFGISLDDFGTKYSNISILSVLKLDSLKIDRSIVSDIYANPRTMKIVTSIVSLCRKLGIETIAEGVETKEQVDILLKIKCDVAQGYYYNKPIPKDIFAKKYIYNEKK